jgi:hypothetical protein
MLKHLEIETFEFAYTVAENNTSGVARQSDFLIDGQPLGKMLGLWEQRPWFGRTRLDEPQIALSSFICQLLGEAPPQNQFGTPRLVLFGCHCGCDYCGIVSCGIERDGSTIRWRDICHEDDFGLGTGYGRIDVLEFSYEQYTATVKTFAVRQV